LKNFIGKRLLFSGGFFFGSGVGVLFGEAFYTASGVDQLLFAREKGVAVGADFDFERVALDGGTRGEVVPAGAMNVYRVIVRMNSGFHG